MRYSALCLVVALAGGTFAAAQEPAATPAPARRTLGLDVPHFGELAYQPAHELRLALWDSPMSRLELGLAREQWALRYPGPVGMVIPFQVAPLPLRFRMAADDVRLLLPGPWTPGWDRLTWQEKLAAGAQTTYVVWTIFEMFRHVRSGELGPGSGQWHGDGMRP